MQAKPLFHTKRSVQILRASALCCQHSHARKSGINFSVDSSAEPGKEVSSHPKVVMLGCSKVTSLLLFFGMPFAATDPAVVFPSLCQHGRRKCRPLPHRTLPPVLAGKLPCIEKSFLPSSFQTTSYSRSLRNAEGPTETHWPNSARWKSPLIGLDRHIIHINNETLQFCN